MSAGRCLSAPAVPPAAKMARFNADLSMSVLEGIETQQNLLNQSPEKPDQLVCSYRAGAGQSHAVFFTQAIPPPRAHACEIRRDHLSPYRLMRWEPSFASLQQKAAEEGGSRIAVTRYRFYDLAGWKATPFRMPAKARRHANRA